VSLILEFEHVDVNAEDDQAVSFVCIGHHCTSQPSRPGSRFSHCY
jgi:hypothetical protein